MEKKKKTTVDREWKMLRNKKYLKYKAASDASIKKILAMGTDRK